eukprot:scaffold96933_cov21-Tisochrysis_lutea.AAC.1
MAEAATFLQKCHYSAEPRSCRSLRPPSKIVCTTSGCPRQNSSSLCWQELPTSSSSTCNKCCSRAELVSMGAHELVYVKANMPKEWCS